MLELTEEVKVLLMLMIRYELRAIQLDKLKQMRLESENSPDVAACEVEMSEAKRTTDVSPTISEDHN